MEDLIQHPVEMTGVGLLALGRALLSYQMPDYADKSNTICHIYYMSIYYMPGVRDGLPWN